MGVAISDVDAFVAYTLGNGQCRKAHIDQKGNVTVANISLRQALTNKFLRLFIVK